ncbi:MAG: 23S rRNA (pseudouridine(1915)-N(3))-methyltransferase RlmH [Paludibacter sp.]|jgi:23S rRNA (pseudouridine1915-N3)-methyltransferase|nr:23S rRNA (pseudouridine(1915)-N(3))-methyltransferase RlmH [Paludibacter sp.]
MKIALLLVGKTENPNLVALQEEYVKRLSYYVGFEQIIIPEMRNTKNLTENEQREREGELILKQLNISDGVVLLDEKGKQYSSEKFAAFLEKKMLESKKRMIFVVGGAYGFSPKIYARANAQLSLSAMTFSHQMVRVFFVEQLYRAFTIINREPYHHR